MWNLNYNFPRFQKRFGEIGYSVKNQRKLKRLTQKWPSNERENKTQRVEQKKTQDWP